MSTYTMYQHPTDTKLILVFELFYYYFATLAVTKQKICIKLMIMVIFSFTGHEAGISNKVIKLKPLAVIKG